MAISILALALATVAILAQIWSRQGGEHYAVAIENHSEEHEPLEAIVEGRDVDAVIGECAFCWHQGQQAALLFDIKGENPITLCHECFERAERMEDIQ